MEYRDHFLWPWCWHTQSESHGVIRWCEEARSLFTAIGLESCDKILAFSNDTTTSDRKGYRDVTRVEIDGQTLYLKRYLRLRLKELLVPRCASHARREFQHYRILSELGIATAVPIVWGEKKRASFIVTREIPGVVLDRHLESCDFSGRRVVIRSLAVLLRNIHDAGYRYLDCKAKHVYICDGRIALLDVERLLPFPRFRSRTKVVAKDLATLANTVSPAVASSSERLYFIKCYLAATRLNSQARDLITGVQKRLSDIALARRWYLRLWLKLLRRFAGSSRRF